MVVFTSGLSSYISRDALLFAFWHRGGWLTKGAGLNRGMAPSGGKMTNGDRPPIVNFPPFCSLSGYQANKDQLLLCDQPWANNDQLLLCGHCTITACGANSPEKISHPSATNPTVTLPGVFSPKSRSVTGNYIAQNVAQAAAFFP